MRHHLPAVTLLLAALLAPAGRGQETVPGQETASAQPPPAPAWSLSLELYAFDPPEDDAYLAPIVRADRDVLHLEARYNYEDRDTLSLFAGRTFDWGEELTVELVPMLGVAMGDTQGLAPALEVELAWKDLSWYAESEYLHDLEDSDDSFFYTWSELTLAPADWLRFGLVAQRTRLYDQELWIDRGLLLEFSGKRLALGAYLFNPDQDDAFLGLTFRGGF